MTANQVKLILGVVTGAALVGIIVLLALGRPVPSELYVFLSLGFGGHLALAGPLPAGTGPQAATSFGLEEILKAAQALSDATQAPKAPAAAATPLEGSPAAPRAPQETSAPVAVTPPNQTAPAPAPAAAGSTTSGGAPPAA